MAEAADEQPSREPGAGESPGRARSGRAAKATGAAAKATGVAAKRAAAVRKTVAEKKPAGRKSAAKRSAPEPDPSRPPADPDPTAPEQDRSPAPAGRQAPRGGLPLLPGRGRAALRAAPARVPLPHAPRVAGVVEAGTGPRFVPAAKVALSTASVYPENTAAAFEIAGRLGYDGVEVMVWTDPVSQDIDALRRLSDYHGVPILAVHAPCLLITQRVWGTDPWTKLLRARAAAEKLGASAVVVHPPFRWQRQYARDFVQGVWRMADETDVRFAVENMYPWRYRDREVAAYAPDWDPTTEDYRHFTVDLSHVATSRTDALAMVDRMGDRLAHVHLADGSGSAKDEHLIPGRGTQPCAELLERLAARGFDGHVVLEVNTRRSPGPVEREAELAEALAFTRLHLATAARVGSPR